MLADLLKEPDQLLALAPEELARLLLADLAAQARRGEALNRHNYFNRIAHLKLARASEVTRAIAEAWSWLETENLLAVDPEQSSHTVFITRRGLGAAASPEEFAAFRSASLLPRGSLHPRLAPKVWATFIRGDYDTAVFQSLRELEVAVREAAGLPDSEYGVTLMRLAFGRGGALEDASALDAEREGLAHLFAGAVATYKNPQSHRAVNLSDAGEAAEIIAFASHLLRVVDRRRAEP